LNSLCKKKKKKKLKEYEMIKIYFKNFKNIKFF
jgi:hypothetical protein